MSKIDSIIGSRAHSLEEQAVLMRTVTLEHREGEGRGARCSACSPHPTHWP